MQMAGAVGGLLSVHAFAAVAIFTGDLAACPDLHVDFRPLDYRKASKSERALVENFHFTPQVETLTAGQSTFEIGADIAYTLRAFPNHSRALYSMAELARREGRSKPNKAMLSAECWFNRAIKFAPDDGDVRIIYGIELLKDGKRGPAIEQLQRAIELKPDNGNAHYNIGLAYFDAGNYEAALEHAKKAESLGFSLPGLRQKLQKAGKWR
jgi:tetratricopeptide (TPR) repeat protein